MAVGSLLTLLDDIASVLDDVALMTKMAAKKTVGVVGDDLALNANQVTGAAAERELPIIWAVTKGSLMNKVILIPIALLLSAFAPAFIVPLLMIGGAYLCFEGVEKILHKLSRSKHDRNDDTPSVERHSTDEQPETSRFNEEEKIKGAIRTDFILSAEIIIIALGTVAEASLLTRVLSLSLVGIGITAAVYGLVALIVKADDFGLYLLHKRGGAAIIGRSILAFMPKFMRTLSTIGTLAMFLVGGGIFTHNVTWLHHWLAQHQSVGGWSGNIAALIVGIIIGIIVSTVVLPLLYLIRKEA